MKKYSLLIGILVCLMGSKSFSSNLVLSSPSFAPNSKIPSQYTCEGANQSPPLVWQDVSKTTQSYVLIVDDPDAPAGDWIHWVLVNIPAGTRSLAAGTAMPEGATGINNSWGESSYRGPCPPSGTHRYFFRLYALDAPLNLAVSASMQDVIKAMENHVLDYGELIATYKKNDSQ